MLKAQGLKFKTPAYAEAAAGLPTVRLNLRRAGKTRRKSGIAADPSMPPNGIRLFLGEEPEGFFRRAYRKDLANL
jgi:hypothetical protein